MRCYRSVPHVARAVTRISSSADRMEGLMAKLFAMLGKSRCLLVPLLAVAAVAAVTVVGAVETRAARATTCGLAIHVQDPDLRASLVCSDRNQPTTARTAGAGY